MSGQVQLLDSTNLAGRNVEDRAYLHTLRLPLKRPWVIPQDEQYNCHGLPIFCVVGLGTAMLENINLNKKLSRDGYKSALPDLQTRLYDLEKACWDNGVPTIVVFEGWDASGKGTTIAALTQRLDPRGFKLYPITTPRTYEQQRPWLWRFWLKVPNRGEMVILDHSWYGRVLEERIERTVPVDVMETSLPRHH